MTGCGEEDAEERLSDSGVYGDDVNGQMPSIRPTTCHQTNAETAVELGWSDATGAAVRVAPAANIGSDKYRGHQRRRLAIVHRGRTVIMPF